MSKHSSKEEYNSYMKEYMLKRYHARRSAAKIKLGGKCVDCGSLEELEFDHIDPETKQANIAKIWSYKEERFWQEVDLCQLLCKKCHEAKSVADAGHNRAAHGTLSIRNCKCDPCRQAKNAYMREWKRKKKAPVAKRPTAIDF